MRACDTGLKLLQVTQACPFQVTLVADQDGHQAEPVLVPFHLSSYCFTRMFFSGIFGVLEKLLLLAACGKHKGEFRSSRSPVAREFPGLCRLKEHTLSTHLSTVRIPCLSKPWGMPWSGNTNGSSDSWLEYKCLQNLYPVVEYYTKCCQFSLD